jgi:hypothetical protein
MTLFTRIASLLASSVLTVAMVAGVAVLSDPEYADPRVVAALSAPRG